MHHRQNQEAVSRSRQRRARIPAKVYCQAHPGPVSPGRGLGLRTCFLSAVQPRVRAWRSRITDTQARCYGAVPMQRPAARPASVSSYV